MYADLILCVGILLTFHTRFKPGPTTHERSWKEFIFQIRNDNLSEVTVSKEYLGILFYQSRKTCYE